MNCKDKNNRACDELFMRVFKLFQTNATVRTHALLTPPTSVWFKVQGWTEPGEAFREGFGPDLGSSSQPSPRAFGSRAVVCLSELPKNSREKLLDHGLKLVGVKQA